MSQSNEAALGQKLTQTQAFAIALGSLVGWGCFVLPGDMFLPQAGPLATLLGFIIGAFLLCFVAVCCSYMNRYVPMAGGAFTYSYVGFGPLHAFICGWVLVLGYIAIVMIDIAAMALIFRFLFPGVLEFGQLYSVAGWDVYTGEVVVMLVSIVFFGFMNYRGVEFVGKLQVVLTVMLTVGIVALFAACASMDTASVQNLNPLFAEHRAPALSILAVFAVSPFLLGGSDTVLQATEEFAFPVKRARAIMVCSIITAVVLYCMVTFSISIVMPYPEMLKKMASMRAAGGTAWAAGEVATMALGKFGSVVLAVGVLGAVCTGTNGFIIASSRLLLSMGRGRILPGWMADIHPKYHTPYKAIFFTCAVALLTPFAGRSVIIWITELSSVGIGLGYLYTCLTMRRIVIGSSEIENKTLSLTLAWIGILTSAIIMALLMTPGSPALISEPSRWFALAWTITGAFFYRSSMAERSVMPEKEIRTNLLGNPKIPVFFGGAK